MLAIAPNLAPLSPASGPLSHLTLVIYLETRVQTSHSLAVSISLFKAPGIFSASWPPSPFCTCYMLHTKRKHRRCPTSTPLPAPYSAPEMPSLSQLCLSKITAILQRLLAATSQKSSKVLRAPSGRERRMGLGEEGRTSTLCVI